MTDSLTGALPPWPDDCPAGPAEAEHAALSRELADLRTRIGALSATCGPELASAVSTLLELHERRTRAVEAHHEGRLEVIARIRTALAHLRRLPSAEAMIAAAPQMACEAGGFDRAVLFRVNGRELLAESLWVKGDPETAARLLAFSRDHPAALASRFLETEMVRRRKPLAVTQLAANPRASAELARACDTRSYVAAPIMPEGRVIGFIHADHRLKPRRVTEFDRNILWAFAEGFGFAVESVLLRNRLQAQGREFRRLVQQTETVLAEHLDAEVELGSGGAMGAWPPPRDCTAVVPIAGNAISRELTRRELEVLELLGAGASNASIAARLCISPDTAKSHVKRIFKKLGAANRVEAATIWLQAQQRWSPDLNEELRTG